MMQSSNLDNDGDSVDFDFFETEGDQIKVYGKTSANQSGSKIVTEAVIESNPLIFLKEKQSVLSKDFVGKVSSNRVNKFKDCSNTNSQSSPSSSLELKLGDGNKMKNESLMNCLAYADEFYSTGNQNIRYSFEDRDSSNSSLSDSTVTTITSDFTSVSPFSSLSNSSLESEEYTESQTVQNNHINYDENQENMINVSETEIKSLKEQYLIESREQTNTNTSECGNKILESNTSSRMQFYSDKSDSESLKEDSYNSDFEQRSQISALEDELDDIAITPQSSSISYSLQPSQFRTSSKLRLRKKEPNLTFKREELIKIERDNLILLKKIMAHSKPKPVSLNHPFCHKKTSAAINRAKQQKKIEKDNYILYSKISAMSRMKKVF